MRRYFILIILICLFKVNLTNAEPSLSSDFRAFGKDFHYLLKSADNLKSKDLLYPIAFIGLSGVGAIYDEDLRKFAKENRSECLDTYTSILNYGGEPVTVLVLPGIIYAAGYIGDNSTLRSTGRTAYEAALLSGLITGAMKVIIGRARPYNDLGNMHFTPFNFKDNLNSFPSGHTTMAFALATIFSHKVDENYAYPIFYAMAASTGFARIYLDKHWLSDVLAGAFIGTVSAKAILNAEKARLKDKRRDPLEKSQFVPLVQFSFKL